MSEMTQQSPERSEIWKRALFMLLFLVLYSVAEIVLQILALVQLVLVLVTGGANDKLLRLGSSLAIYVRQVFSYLTFNTEEQPFPMSEWPADEAQHSPWFVQQAPTSESSYQERPSVETQVDDRDSR